MAITPGSWVPSASSFSAAAISCEEASSLSIGARASSTRASRTAASLTGSGGSIGALPSRRLRSPASGIAAGTSPRPRRSARRSGHTLGILSSCTWALLEHLPVSSPTPRMAGMSVQAAEPKRQESAFTSSPRLHAASTAWVGNSNRTCRTAFGSTQSFSGPTDVRAIGDWGLNLITRRITMR